MKLTSVFGALVGMTTVSLSVFAQTVELEEPQLRAAKDAIIYGRDPESEDAPGQISLALVGENLFVSVPFSVTGIANSTKLEWRVEIGDDVFEQEGLDLEEGDTSGLLISNIPNADVTSDEVDFVAINERGSAVDVVVVVEIDGEKYESVTSMLTISNFESVLPLIMLVLLAVMSRNVYVAMFFGIWIGSLIITNGDIVLSFQELFDVHMIPSITDEYNMRTIMFTLFLGGLIAMIKKAGGQDGFSDAVGRFATTARSTQLAAVGAGVGLFFDDYSSVLILGASFKKLTDQFYVSREKLAFVADSTSAPIASIAPVSSWIAFELSRIKPELDNIRATFGNTTLLPDESDLQGEYPFFLSTIPSRYYPLFMLVIQVTLIVAGVEFGPMLYAERKTRIEKRTDGGDGAMDVPVEMDKTNPEEDTPRRAWNFFIPIGFFIGALLVSLVNIGVANIRSSNDGVPEEDQIEENAREIFGNTDSFLALVYTTMGASLFSLVFFLLQTKQDGYMVPPTPASLCDSIDCRLKSAEDVAIQEGFEEEPTDSSKPRPLLYFTEGINTWVEGFKNLVPAILILCMAFTIKSIVIGCATDRFFTDFIVNSTVDAGALPTLIFIISSLLALTTGTSFGTMSIMFPLVSFATFQKSEGDIELFTIALSSIMAGAIFGDHSSLISDTTILSSIGAGCSIGSHVYTQFPYALWGALFAIVFGTLPAGYGAPAALMLVIGSAALIVCTILVGAPIVAKSGRLDWFSELYLKVTSSQSLQEYKTKTADFAAENPELVNKEPFAYILGVFGRGDDDDDKVGIQAEEVKVEEAEEAKLEEPEEEDMKVKNGSAPSSPMDI